MKVTLFGLLFSVLLIMSGCKNSDVPPNAINIDAKTFGVNNFDVVNVFDKTRIILTSTGIDYKDKYNYSFPAGSNGLYVRLPTERLAVGTFTDLDAYVFTNYDPIQSVTYIYRGGQVVVSEKDGKYTIALTGFTYTTGTKLSGSYTGIPTFRP